MKTKFYLIINLFFERKTDNIQALMDNPYRRPHPTLESITQIAKRTLLRNGTHLPTVVVEGNKQSIGIYIDQFAPTHEERAYQLYLLGYALAQTKEVGVLQQVFLISEGWMSVAAEGKPPQSPPSQDLQRKEALIITQRTISAPQP